MGKIYESISLELSNWISKQRIFFVSTAPLSKEGHVNCSPKGGDTFRVFNDREVGYLDLTGSGVESIAHVQENGRIVVMFCAFDGPPKIARLHGLGEVVYPDGLEFSRLRAHFPDAKGIRAIIRIKVSRISDSCGFSVPLYDYRENREVLNEWASRKSEPELSAYRKGKNAFSIDQIVGYKVP